MCVYSIYIRRYCSLHISIYVQQHENKHRHTHTHTHTHTFAYWVETSRIPTFKKIFCNIIFSSTFYLFHLHLYMIRMEIDLSFQNKMFLAIRTNTRLEKYRFLLHIVFFPFFPTNPQLFIYHKKACLFAYILPLISVLHREILRR